MSGKINVIKNKIKATIKILKRPKVSKEKGRVIRDKTGFIILNPAAKRNPAIITVSIPP
jgi:hypothetical protein